MDAPVPSVVVRVSSQGPVPIDVLDPDELRACVHCGFCLPACPTYDVLGNEMDSPRGRLDLMRQVAEGAADWDGAVADHLDACLGCLACVTACPSGVRYDHLIEAARAGVESTVERGPTDRAFRWLVFALFPRPRRLRVAALALAGAQRIGVDRAVARALAGGDGHGLRARLAALAAVAPPTDVRAVLRPLPPRVPARGPVRVRVALVTGCVQSVFFRDVHAATARVLASVGCEVLIPPSQGCCGALDVHTGRTDAARSRARDLVGALSVAGADRVVVNAAGCGSTIRDYGRVLADDPDWAARGAALGARTRDVLELVDELGGIEPRRPLPLRIGYQDACHLRHAQGVRDAPRRLLRSIDGVDLVDLPDPDRCCGSAGVYNLLQPSTGAELGRRRAADVRAAAVDVLTSANPGCLLQIRRHLGADGPRLLHPVQVLDAAIR